MIKKFLIIISFIVSLSAVDNLTAQKQNALYIQTLIETEENIAKMFEKYILTEFAIPTLEKLSTDSYLGSNFSTTNKMGSNIAFKSTNDLTIKYAITKDEYGIVHTADTSKCIGCANCVIGCPFGVPQIPDQSAMLMMKCNMCYDRTSTGLKPMCATVCPSGALTFDTRENVAKKRPNSSPVNRFIFGKEVVNTKVNIMMPKGSEELKVF